MLKIIFLIIFLIVAFVHLFVPHDKRLTKSLLLPAILAYYLSGANEIEILLVLAFVFSWLGDVLLMINGNKWFTLGGISFMLAHFLFIAVYVSKIGFSDIGIVLPIIAAVIYLAVSIRVMRYIKPNTPKPMFFPMLMYLFANSAMNVFALMILMSRMNAAAVAAYIGALLFFISDSVLFISRSGVKKLKHSFLLIMFTYIFGEFLIAHSMMLI